MGVLFNPGSVLGGGSVAKIGVSGLRSRGQCAPWRTVVDPILACVRTTQVIRKATEKPDLPTNDDKQISIPTLRR